MSTAKKYFQTQLSDPAFKQSYMEEKVKLDIEYQLEELKKDVQSRKSSEVIIRKINRLEKYVLSA